MGYHTTQYKPIAHDVFIEKSNLYHNNYYDYSETKYIDYKTIVTIKCPYHGSFLQSGGNHLRGGCRKCSDKLRGIDKRLTIDEFKSMASKVHDNKFDYSNVIYVNNTVDVSLNCPFHGEFKQRPSNHLNGGSCFRCKSKKSKVGTNWLNSLNNSNIIHEYVLPEHTKRKVDGYDQTTNTVYQFHGDYFHGNPIIYPRESFNKKINITNGEVYDITMIKDQQLRDWGYNLVIMWEYDWKKLIKDTKLLLAKQ